DSPHRATSVPFPLHRSSCIVSIASVIFPLPLHDALPICVLPRNVVSACRLHRANRRPGTELALRDSGAAEFEFRPGATVVEKIISAELTTDCQSIDLNNCCLLPDDPVAVEILVEDRLERL